MFRTIDKIGGIVQDTKGKFQKKLERLNRLRNDKKYKLEKSLKRSSTGGALLTESLAFRRKRTDGVESSKNQEYDLQSLV